MGLKKYKISSKSVARLLARKTEQSKRAIKIFKKKSSKKRVLEFFISIFERADKQLFARCHLW